MNHQRRSLEIRGRQMRRPFAVKLAVRVRRALELPLVEPELFRRAPRRLAVEHAVMRHDALEAVGMAEDPVGHVSAVAGAQRALPGLIYERVMLLGVVEALHQVFKRSPAPVAVDCVNEFLPVAGRAVEVDHDDHVSVGREQLGVPAIAPIVSPRSLRPAVDEELHRIFLA